jgi:hypothetical protein
MRNPLLLFGILFLNLEIGLWAWIRFAAVQVRRVPGQMQGPEMPARLVGGRTIQLNAC